MLCIIIYVLEHRESIAAISLTLNTQNDCFKANLAIFKKKMKFSVILILKSI